MKVIADSALIQRLQVAQAGVFSTGDLRVALAERHPAAFKRRIRALLEQDILFRFTRGFYVTKGFDLSTLSQRIAPDSCISFANVLARWLVIGTNPERRVVATKIGRARSYEALGHKIDHVGISGNLAFGCAVENGVRYADVEKAVLDVLYFHLHGRRAVFDIYSDINLSKLDEGKVLGYLTRYQNRKFVMFVKNVLRLQ